MTVPRIDWDALGGKHNSELVDAARRLFSIGGPFQISAVDFAAETTRPALEAEKLLAELCPPLEKVSSLSCPNCDIELSDEERRLEFCPNCSQSYAENGGLRQTCRFVYNTVRSRDVIWALALHGMNTRGAWQEELNWRVSTAYGRSVPVAIYKYGLVRPGAIWRPSLRAKIEDVASKIAELRGDTFQSGFSGPPDVIAHSLGTWLIGHALQWYPSLRIGRLILTGSILRPDFDWARILARGQVEAILNHYGSEDFWARIAHFVIPDSGPSGRRGFNAGNDVTQVCAQGFGHSDFFLQKNLGTVFENVWRPFLTSQLVVEISASAEPSEWAPAPWILRATILPLILLTVYWAIVGALVGACLLGLYDGARWLLRS
jgi:hypothetical protein